LSGKAARIVVPARDVLFEWGRDPAPARIGHSGQMDRFLRAIKH
jgi:hypothetical protein